MGTPAPNHPWEESKEQNETMQAKRFNKVWHRLHSRFPGVELIIGTTMTGPNSPHPRHIAIKDIPESLTTYYKNLPMEDPNNFGNEKELFETLIRLAVEKSDSSNGLTIDTFPRELKRSSYYWFYDKFSSELDNEQRGELFESTHLPLMQRFIQHLGSDLKVDGNIPFNSGQRRIILDDNQAAQLHASVNETEGFTY